MRASSRKKASKARCKRAILPIYIGKPAPVILTPRSKSMRLYFLQRSQWHKASSGSCGITPPSFTTTLSLASFPSGTSSAGMLGMLHNKTVNSCSASAMSVCNCLSFSLYTATLAFTSSASCVLPSFISMPICFDMLFASCLFLSNFC